MPSRWSSLTASVSARRILSATIACSVAWSSRCSACSMRRWRIRLGRSRHRRHGYWQSSVRKMLLLQQEESQVMFKQHPRGMTLGRAMAHAADQLRDPNSLGAFSDIDSAASEHLVGARLEHAKGFVVTGQASSSTSRGMRQVVHCVAGSAQTPSSCWSRSVGVCHNDIRRGSCSRAPRMCPGSSKRTPARRIGPCRPPRPGSGLVGCRCATGWNSGVPKAMQAVPRCAVIQEANSGLWRARHVARSCAQCRQICHTHGR
mmetsp:Transcript_61722/g.200045  ORF Transcript_61722/g.200045 Transcript_61722/m.200045 type:complete len:260 (+) Transcript_61722:221-1000(+)